MLESLGLAGLFIAVMLSGSIVPFSSDAIYVAALLSGKFPVFELSENRGGKFKGNTYTDTAYYIANI